MDRWVGKVAIVTGASSGIGAAIAGRLVVEGMKVVGLARRKDRLDSLAENLSGEKGQFHPFQADVSKEEDILRAFAWIKQNIGPAQILVNNAGIFKPMSFSNFKTEDAKSVLDLNVLSLCMAIREVLKVFKENSIHGHIININSIAGHIVYDVPNVGIHTASKFAVTALTEALFLEIKRMELETKVTSISPGLVETEALDETQWEKLKRNPKFSALKPRDIADAVVYVLSTPIYCQIDELTISPCGSSDRGMKLDIN